jgi:IQ calmodulin-binding motif
MSVHEKVIKIQKVIRGHLIRKKLNISVEQTKKSLKKNLLTSDSFSEPDALLLKKKIKIEKFVELISQNTFDSFGKALNNAEAGSDLASFRVNLENAEQSTNSFNQDPSMLMGSIPISPIIAISSNFTLHTIPHSNKNIERINIVDIENSEDESAGLLSPYLKKMKFNQFTPTFPLKNEENNISWDKIKLPGLQENENAFKAAENIHVPEISSVNPESNRITSFSDLAAMQNIELVNKDPSPSSLKIPNNKNIQGVKNTDREINYLKIHTQENTHKPEVPKTINASFFNTPDELLIGNSSKPDKEDDYKYNDTVFINESFVLEISKNSSKKEFDKKSLSVSKFSSIKLEKFIPHRNTLNSIKKPQSSLKKKFFNKPEEKKYLQVPKSNLITISNSNPNLVRTPSKTTNLPKIRKSVSKKRKTINCNPYSSEWMQKTLKNHFKLKLKLANENSAAKYLVTKFVKRKIRKEK